MDIELHMVDVQLIYSQGLHIHNVHVVVYSIELHSVTDNVPISSLLKVLIGVLKSSPCC